MSECRTVFPHLLDFVTKYEFNKCSASYHGNLRVRNLPAYNHFLVSAFAQLIWRESLRDIEICPASSAPSHIMPVSVSPLQQHPADADENRDGRIFTDFAHALS